MTSLFPTPPQFPEGFQYHDDFLSHDEETHLTNEVRKLDLHNMIFQGYTANRKVASFGFDYSFDKRRLSKGKDIPGAFHQLMQKVASHLHLSPSDFEELLVTEYPIGSVINWHRDAPPFRLIAGISLLSDCTFRLRPHDKTKQSRASILSFPVRHRSLYIIDGPARTDWEHSIRPVNEVRYSITLRTLVK